jgi:hypothetical protein
MDQMIEPEEHGRRGSRNIESRLLIHPRKDPDGSFQLRMDV